MKFPKKYEPVLKKSLSMVSDLFDKTGSLDLFFLFGSFETPYCGWLDEDLTDIETRINYSSKLRKFVRRKQSEFFLMIMTAKITNLDNGEVTRGIVYQLETKEGYWLATQQLPEINIELKLKCTPEMFTYSKVNEGFFANML